MCRARAVRSESFDSIEIGEEVHRDRGQPHDAPIAGGVQIARPGVRVPVELVTPQRGRHGVPDVKTRSGAAEIASIGPRAITLHLIAGVEPIPLYQTGCQAQSHGGVVCPLTRQKPERSTPDHVRQGLEGSAPAELQGGADGVTDRKPKETSSESLFFVHRFDRTIEEPELLKYLRRLLFSSRLKTRCLVLKRLSSHGLQMPSSYLITLGWNHYGRSRNDSHVVFVTGDCIDLQLILVGRDHVQTRRKGEAPVLPHRQAADAFPV
jgi:hypothetical protein